MKRVAGYILLVIAFLINIPLKAGITAYGLVYSIRAFVDGNISTGIIAVAVTVICLGIAHFVVGRVSRPLNGLVTSLLGKTDVETISRDEREWRRKQAEKGYSEGKRSILDAEAQHIRDSLGDSSSTGPTTNRQKRA